MVMIRASVDLELLGHLATQRSLGQHTHDSTADCKFRLLSQQLAVLGFLQAADIAGVMIINLLIQLLAGHDDLILIFVNDIFAVLHIVVVIRLILAAKDVRDLAGHTAKHLTLGIDNIPLTGNVSRFRHERLQRFFLPK